MNELHKTNIDFIETPTQPENNIKLTNRGKAVLALSGLAIGAGLITGINSTNSADALNRDSVIANTTFVVQAGDTYSDIAKKLPGFSEASNINEIVYDIQQLNPNVSPGQLRPGMTVIVPKSIE